MFRTVLGLIWLGVAAKALTDGLEYYALPLQARAFSSLHDVYAPSGSAGLDLGITGTVMILAGVILYGARKRLRVLHHAGQLKHWLQFHIFLCTLGPFLILLHTSFKFGGIISIAFWSMVLVVSSGVLGLYVYAHIPKTINGQFLGLEALDKRRESLVAAAARDSGLDAEQLDRIVTPLEMVRPRSTLQAFRLAVFQDLGRRIHVKRVKAALGRLPVPASTRSQLLDHARAQLWLQQQIVLLQPFQRLFRYWHVFHVPLAVLLLVILTLHVGVAVMLGYAWAGA